MKLQHVNNVSQSYIKMKSHLNNKRRDITWFNSIKIEKIIQTLKGSKKKTRSLAEVIHTCGKGLYKISSEIEVRRKKDTDEQQDAPRSSMPLLFLDRTSAPDHGARPPGHAASRTAMSCRVRCTCQRRPQALGRSFQMSFGLVRNIQKS